MRTAEFNFTLPPRLIAQQPAPHRDDSRLLVLDRATGQTRHHPGFRAVLSYLRPGDLLVLNDTRVLPARLRGRKAGTGGEIEILLLEEVATNEWWTLLRPGKRVRPGTVLTFERAGVAAASAAVIEKTAAGHCRLHFSGAADIRQMLDQLGEIPLPPYITRRPAPQDWERYQTVYARRSGSVAAPTAGLHFTDALLEQARQLGVEIERVTLHIGLGTFAPVKAEVLENHVMHEERFVLSSATAQRINAARAAGGRIIAVGTTTVRVLETVAAEHQGRLVGAKGATRIFIYPPYQFRVVDALLTNFHLPQSTLLMLVSAFAAPGETHGRELVLRAYGEAIRKEYRFFSYGDAMLIL